MIVDEVIGDHANQREQFLGRYEVVARLRQKDEDPRDVLLVGGEIRLNERVEREHAEFVVSDEPRDQVHQQQPHRKLLLRLFLIAVPRFYFPEEVEELLGEALRVVDERDRRESRVAFGLIGAAKLPAARGDLPVGVALARLGFVAVAVVVDLLVVHLALLLLVLLHAILDAEEEADSADAHARMLK